MKPNPLPFIAERWHGVPAPIGSFAQKTVIVTGANSGLGYEAAAQFASLGASKVILAVRNEAKGEAAKRQIEKRVNRGNDAIEAWKLDMDSFTSIKSFADRVDKAMERLDVVVLNAGASPKDFNVGDDGWETMLQVNVLGPALLSLLLLPKLYSSAATPTTSTHTAPHLLLIGSESHRWLEPSDIPEGPNILNSLNTKPANKKWDPLSHSATTKLLTQYVANSIADITGKPGGQDIIVTSVCPGATKSDLMRDMGDFPTNIALKIFDLLFNKTTEQGARVYVNAANLGAEAHGKWYKTTKLTPQGGLVTSQKGQEMQKQVWREIVDVLKARFPEVETLASP